MQLELESRMLSRYLSVYELPKTNFFKHLNLTGQENINYFEKFKTTF